MVLANGAKLSESIPYYQKAVSLDPANPVAYHNLGNTYAGLGLTNQAINSYNKALELDPRFLFTYGKLINLYTAFGRYNEAITTLEQYIKQVGPSPELNTILENLKTRTTTQKTNK